MTWLKQTLASHTLATMIVFFASASALSPCFGSEPAEKPEPTPQPVASDAIDQWQLKIIHPDAKDVKAFIRANRCFFGDFSSGHPESKVEKTSFGWNGMIHYPTPNFSDGGSFLDHLQILRPKQPALAREFSQWLEGKSRRILVAESKQKPGYHEVVGIELDNAIAKSPGADKFQWLRFRENWAETSDGDFGSFFQSSEYRQKDLLPTQIRLLKSGTVKQRREAAIILARIGADARDQTPELLALADSENEELAMSACYALGIIGGEQAKQVLPKIVRSAQAGRIGMEYAVNSVKPFGYEAVPTLFELIDLIEMTESEDLQPIRSAIHHLGEICKAENGATKVPADKATLHKAVIAKLKQVIANEDFCYAAASALGKMGAEAKEAIPTLLEALAVAKKDHARLELVAIIESLGMIDAQNAKVQEALQPFLTYPNGQVRLATRRALRSE